MYATFIGRVRMEIGAKQLGFSPAALYGQSTEKGHALQTHTRVWPFPVSSLDFSGWPDRDPVPLLRLTVSVLRPGEAALGNFSTASLGGDKQFHVVWTICLCPRIMICRLFQRHAIIHLVIAIYGQDRTLGHKVSIIPAECATEILVMVYGCQSGFDYSSDMRNCMCAISLVPKAEFRQR
jgi:hypothetical protein